VSEDTKLQEKTATEYRAAEYKSPYAALADELYRERVLRARQASPEQRFLAGEELFEWACSITMAGIENENPGIGREECLKIVEQRLEMRARMERGR
jgi:hypothetical protein